jgi:hypothetical protein
MKSGSFVLAIWGVVSLAVVVRAIVAPHQNTVFIVFRDAGGQWLSGGNLYSQVGKYLYSPLAAAFFSPFALIPDAVGAALWRLVIVAVYLLAFIFWLRRFGKDFSGAEFFPVAMLMLLPMSVGNMNNGQASLVVIGLLLFAGIAMEASHWTLTAFLIALATFFKIYPLVVGLLFVVIYPRQLAPRLLLSLLGLWLLSLILQRPGYVLQQYQNWLACLGADQRRVSGELGSWRDFWLLLRIARLPITVPLYALLQVFAGGVAAAFCWWMRRIAFWEERRVIWTAFTLGCLWITLFGPSTEQATYIFLAPSLAFAGAATWRSGQPGGSKLGLYRSWLAASYLLLVGADAVNAWVPAIRQNNYLHAVEPIAALLFTGFVLAWIGQAERLRTAARQAAPILESK